MSEGFGRIWKEIQHKVGSPLLAPEAIAVYRKDWIHWGLTKRTGTFWEVGSALCWMWQYPIQSNVRVQVYRGGRIERME